MGLTRPSSHNLKYLGLSGWPPPRGGHDDGIGGNIRVIKKQEANATLLAESGIKHLQDVLADELAREKRTIVLSVVRMRAASL